MADERQRFGSFEFDPSTRELRRNGALVRLQSQPAEVLAALLAQAGQVVSRAALREALWGRETHVDFEGGLNVCVAQLRSALGDSAESPLYIRTIPRRGYQFIAPVTAVGQAAPPTSLPWRRAVLSTLAVVALGLGGWFAWAHRPGRPQAPLRIAVARFENQSGDGALDLFTEGLWDSVVSELTNKAPGHYEVIGNAAILQRVRERQDLSLIAEELKADYVVLGQVSRASGKGRVLIHLIRLPDQSHRWVTRVEDPDFGDALGTQRAIAGRAVLEFRARLPR